MLSLDKGYDLRSKRPETAEDPHLEPPRKRCRHTDYIGQLPHELLVHILSYVNAKDLYYNVRLVCKEWNRAAMLSSSWKTIEAHHNLPLKILLNWIRLSPIIKHVKIVGRNDADHILEYLGKHSRNLRTIIVEDCWGSPEYIPIRSKPLCNLLSRCNKLQRIHFEKVRIRSARFFQLLVNKRLKRKFLQMCYVGPVSPKQFNTLKTSCSGWIFSEYILT